MFSFRQVFCAPSLLAVETLIFRCRLTTTPTTITFSHSSQERDSNVLSSTYLMRTNSSAPMESGKKYNRLKYLSLKRFKINFTTKMCAFIQRKIWKQSKRRTKNRVFWLSMTLRHDIFGKCSPLIIIEKNNFLQVPFEVPRGTSIWTWSRWGRSSHGQVHSWWIEKQFVWWKQ